MNGRRIECDVENVTIECQREPSDYMSLSGRSFHSEPIFSRVEVTGIIRKLIEDNDMCYDKSCAEDCGRDDSLAAKYKKLELAEGRRKLIERGILNLDGTLTKKGESFFLNVLLDEDNEELLVEAVDAIDEADEEKNKSCN